MLRPDTLTVLTVQQILWDKTGVSVAKSLNQSFWWLHMLIVSEAVPAHGVVASSSQLNNI